MRLLYLLVIAGIVLAVYYGVKIITERRLSEQLAQIERWKQLPFEERFVAHTEHAAEMERKDASRSQAAITFCVTVFLTGVAMVAWLQDTVTANRDEIERACAVDARFRDLLDARLEDEVRVRQAQRDELADSLAEDTTTRLNEIPGFDDLAASVQTFVLNIVAAQVEQRQTELAQLDADLGQLRAEKTAVREFNARQDCPNS